MTNCAQSFVFPGKSFILWTMYENNQNNQNSSDQYRNNYGMNNSPQPETAPWQSSTSLDTTAMILGFVAIIGSFFMPVILPMIAGSISIILAILSKGGRSEFSPAAKRGFTFSLVAIIGTFVMMIALAFTTIRMMRDPSYRDQFNQVSQQLYGYTMDEMLENSFGYTMEGLLDRFGLTVEGGDRP